MLQFIPIASINYPTNLPIVRHRHLIVVELYRGLGMNCNNGVTVMNNGKVSGDAIGCYWYFFSSLTTTVTVYDNASLQLYNNGVAQRRQDLEFGVELLALLL